jgi:hypothetical protein
LTVTGEGVRNAGFLHLVVLNPRGRLIKDAQSWLSGPGAQAELTLSLPADSYVVGVQAYTELGPGEVIYGSAQYQLTAEY